MELRISSGKYKNKKLKVAQVSKPVMERVKSAVFSIIGDKVITAKCLDLYAGSGNLGLESLSLGAKSCLFVENDFEAVKTIIENIKNVTQMDITVSHISDLSVTPVIAIPSTSFGVNSAKQSTQNPFTDVAPAFSESIVIASEAKQSSRNHTSDNAMSFPDLIGESIPNSSTLEEPKALQGTSDIKLIKDDVQKFVVNDPSYYDIIFMDPPYNAPIKHTLKYVHELLSENGLIAYFHEAKSPIDITTINPHLKIIDSRKYGKTQIDFLVNSGQN